jgi:putative FmdB family regulatory protein
MPLYEYDCKDCGEHFEKLVRMSDDPQSVQCPACAGAKVERALSLFATGGRPVGSDSAPACGPVG